MHRTRLLSIALGLLVALALPATAVARPSLLPLSQMPFMLEPEACAADEACTRFVVKRDAAHAGETAEQRAAREARFLGFTPSRAVDRRVKAAIDSSFKGQFAELRDHPQLQRRYREALSYESLRRIVRDRLDARGWSRNDFGDLLAFQAVTLWQQANGGTRIDAASADAFRTGLRDLMTRAAKRHPSDAQLQYAGEALALVAVGFEQIIVATPRSSRPAVRRIAARGARELLRDQYGVDPAKLRQVPTGFAPK